MSSRNSRAMFQASLTTLAVLALVFSFGLHSFQVPHTHPGHAHTHEHTAAEPTKTPSTVDFSYLSEYAHLSEKKFLILLVALLALSLALTKILLGSWQEFILNIRNLTNSFRKQSREEAVLVLNYLEAGFSSGLLNPKLH